MELEQLKTAATMRAEGATLQAIGNVLGVTKQTAQYHLKKDQLQQLIKNAQSELINQSLMTAVDNQIAKIKASQTITNKILNEEKLTDGAVKLLELGHDAEKQMLQSTGIHPSHTQSIQINNILIDNRSELSPTIEAMLVKHLQVEDNIIDGEIIPVKESNNKDAP